MDSKNIDDNKNKKIIIISLVIIGVVLLILGLYLIYSNNNKNNSNKVDNNIESSENNNTTEENVDNSKEENIKYTIPTNAVNYKGKDKNIYLVEIENDANNIGLDPHTYELYTNDNKIKVHNPYKNNNNTFVVFDDYDWYLLNDNNKSIISYYESKNKIIYDRNGWVDAKQDWYVIHDNGKIVSIVNENNGEILSFNANYPNEYIIQNEIIYLRFNNNISIYDAVGKLLQNKKYEKIVSFNFNRTNDSSYSIVYNSNKYYYISLVDDKSIELDKVDIYEGDGKNLTVYSLEKIGDINHKKLLLIYDNEYYTARGFEENNNGNSVINVDSIKGIGQYYYGSFILDKNNKKLISFNVTPSR